jgi:hypothetical protein
LYEDGTIMGLISIENASLAATEKKEHVPARLVGTPDIPGGRYLHANALSRDELAAAWTDKLARNTV